MASELILINISSSPTTVSLPTGRPIIVLPGFGVAGDYFVKYMQIGVLMPIASIPSSFKVKGIAEPLRTEGVRTTRDPSEAVNKNQPFRPATTGAAATPKSSLVAMAEAGLGTSDKDIAKAHNLDIKEGDLLDGLTREAWVSRIQAISEATLAQQMKLDQLRNLARFLGIYSADILATKADIISAVRIRCRG